MIHPDLRFEGFDSKTWTNLLSLFAPGIVQRKEGDPEASDAPELDAGHPPPPRGSLFVVVDEEQHPVVALHTERGRLRDLDTMTDPEALCLTYGARRCVIARDGALEDFAERMALRLGSEDDYLEQCLAVLRTIREMHDAGLVRIWPRHLSQVPIPSAETVQRALDLVLPDGRVAVMGVWRAGHLWTALAVRRREGCVDWVVGPDFIGQWCGGTLEGDYRERAAGVLAAVDERMGPVHVGLFTEAHTVRRLLRQGEPGAWAAAAAGREVLLQPMPPYVGMALGADLLRALTRSSTRLLGDRIDIGAIVTPLADAVREQLGRARSLTQTLGFDPLEVLGRYLRARSVPREEQPEAPDESPSGTPEGETSA